MHTDALTGCNTIFFWQKQGNNTRWKTFIKYPHLLISIGRDDTVRSGENAEKFVCASYGIEEKGVKGIDDARHSLFAKDKRDIETLPPSHYALELHS